MGRKSRLKRERKLKEQQKTFLEASKQRVASNIEKFYFTVIKWGIYFILFIPLIIRKEFIFPFVFPKSTVFQITVEIIFGLWILLAWRNPKFRPHFGVLGKALALFIGINIIAGLAGVDFLRSFWSTQERMTGIFALLHLFAFFIILITIFKNWRSWKRLFDLAIVSALAMSFYALSQKLGLTPAIGGGVERLTGAIGNPSFLASWLLFGVFFSLWGMVRRINPNQNAENTLKWKRWIWRVGFYLPSFIFISTILIFTGGRGPFFASGLGLILFAVAVAILSKHKIKKRIAIAGILIVVTLAIGLFLAKDSPLVKDNYYLKRYGNVFSPQKLESSLKARFIVWDMAFRSWEERPLLGWGPENFNVGFNKYLEPELATTGTVWYDRAHNIVLDTLNSTGIIGLLSYLGIFVIAGWMLVKNANRPKGHHPQSFTGSPPLGGNRYETVTYIVPVIILICYFFQNFFVFDMVNTYIMFFLLLGFISFLGQGETTQTRKRIQPKTFNPVHWGRIMTVAILVIIFIYGANIRPAQVSFYGIKGGRVMRIKNYSVALQYYKKAFSYNNFTQGEVAKEFVRSLEGNINYSDFAPQKQEFLKLGIKEVEETYQLHPNNVVFSLLLAKLYNLGSQFDQSYLKKGEIVIKKAMELSPKRQTVYWIAGQNKLLLKKNDEALDLYKKALYLNPKRTEKAKAFWYLGVALNLQGKYEQALTKLNKARSLKYNWNNVRSIMFLAGVYEKTGKVSQALKLYEQALKLEPENASIQNKIKDLENKIVSD